MEPDVRIRQRGPALVVSKRLAVGHSEIGGVLGTAFGEVYGHLVTRGIASDGPPFVIHHGTPMVDDPLDVEICAPVARPTDPPAGWQMRELPAGTFVSLLHLGPYDTISAAYEALTAWLGTHDLAMAGPPREVYLSEPETPPEEIRTIVELPVVELAAPVTTG